MRNTLVKVLNFCLLGVFSQFVQTTGYAAEGQLLFSSGFEQGVYVTGDVNGLGLEGQNGIADDYKFIVGSDKVGAWPIDILGASGSGLHYVSNENYQGKKAANLDGDFLDAYIDTETGHDGKRSDVLITAKYKTPPLPAGVEREDDITQIPYEILDLNNGAGLKKDLYIRYWMKVGSDSPDEQSENLWRALFEWKSKDYQDDNNEYGDGFRLISYIYSGDDGIPYWVIKGDKDPSIADDQLNTDSDDATWFTENKKVPVPIDKWFVTEFYWHWDEGAYGNVVWKVNGQVIADHKGPSTRNGKPLDFIMLTQTYGSQDHIYQSVDDIEIWEGLPSRYAVATELIAGDKLSSFVARNKKVQYIVSAKAGDTVSGVLNQLSADADLYIKVGSKANRNSYDCVSWKGGKNADNCSVKLIQDSDVYISVYGFRASEYQLKVDISK